MVVSKSRSSASLTVIAPVPIDGERQVAVAAAVGVPAGDGPLRGDVVVAGVVDVDDGRSRRRSRRGWPRCP